MSQNSNKELFWFGAILMVIAFVVITAIKPNLIWQLFGLLTSLVFFVWPPFFLFLVSKKHRAEKRAEWKTRSTGMVIAEYVYIFLPPLFFWGLIMLFLYAVR